MHSRSTSVFKYLLHAHVWHMWECEHQHYDKYTTLAVTCCIIIHNCLHPIFGFKLTILMFIPSHVLFASLPFALVLSCCVCNWESTLTSLPLLGMHTLIANKLVHACFIVGLTINLHPQLLLFWHGLKLYFLMNKQHWQLRMA